jgi:hypothetical protein
LLAIAATNAKGMLPRAGFEYCLAHRLVDGLAVLFDDQPHRLLGIVEDGIRRRAKFLPLGIGEAEVWFALDESKLEYRQRQFVGQLARAYFRGRQRALVTLALADVADKGGGVPFQATAVACQGEFDRYEMPIGVVGIQFDYLIEHRPMIAPVEIGQAKICQFSDGVGR